jgi:putative membrane-bound dehydrogenase-like protein
MPRFPSIAALVLLCIGAPIPAQTTPPSPTPLEGILPVGADGKPLNLDFETGTLKDWTAEGDAFAGQPIRGDTVFPRRSDNKSQHQGNYWIGGYELRGDKPQGTLTSVAFKVTHPWGSFLVGGGPHTVTCVELVRQDSGTVFHRASGLEEENLRREVVDLRPHLGKQIFIRLVDKHTGHWGHINFDDFRFHAQKPDFPPRPKAQPLPAPDVYKYAGLPPKKAAEVMTVPEGFHVTLFAGEPDVHQPIAMCLDDRGRVWVAEAYCYPIRRPDKEANDRIVIFEDTDGDGVFDKRTVFMEGLNLVSGLEVGHGGVWIGAAPYFMFVPMKDDKPAGPPQIILDGWAWQDTHETLNTFTWGPDGWLYGCHGVFTHSKVGKPGTPDDQRQPINAGIWRYHPTRHVFEVFAHGTSNPWGLDFNDHGQMFCEACVIPHCFHIIQGGRYNRQANTHFNPFTFADIATIADHRHYVGANPHGGNERSDSAGGGHAHCGTMIYLGGAWPAEYRGKMFMGNIHGRRLNVDVLTGKGSGYLASHSPDFLLANDAWARFINLRYGPDGNVYLIDWYDKQACHTGDPQVWDRGNGRIYKISYRGTKPVQVDLAKKSSAELALLQTHENDWYVRHARRLLQERGADAQARQILTDIAFPQKSSLTEAQRLRGLWALHVTGNLTEEFLLRGLADKASYVRAWSIQLALENNPASPMLVRRLEELARTDTSSIVRLYLAAGAQRLPLAQRWQILDGLLRHGEDAGDANLPLMYWYAAEPLGGAEPARALSLAAKSKLPPLLPFMARRIGMAGMPEALALLADALHKTDDSVAQLAILRGMSEALKGRRDVPMPKEWPVAFAKLQDNTSADIRSQALTLAVIFGDARGLAEMRRLLVSPTTPLNQRQNALAALLSAKDKELPSVLHKLIGEPNLRGAALSGLAVYDDPRTPQVIIEAFPRLSSEEKRAALGTLAARVLYGKELLDAVAAKKIAPTELSADLVRQLRNLGNKELAKRVADVWGVVRDTPADRAELIARARKSLAVPAVTDVSLGRAVYAKTCAQCHTLFGAGGKVGPEITGANRQSLDYLLENIFDPSAVIPKEYAATLVELNDGRILTGIVKAEAPATITLVTANETLTLPVADIASRKTSDKSMMPDDIVGQLKDHELRALIAYLQSPAQVPILATADNAKDIFNGKDLAGWDGDLKFWRVENGAIVGRTDGLKHNEFLRSQMIAEDFRLTLKVKLVPDQENSGVQFRSAALAGGEVKGPQADIGAGWWGKLYEENGRGLLWKKPGDPFVNKDAWNDYVIEAKGSHIRTFINGKPCVDLDDPQIARRGLFAFQLHSGGPMEVRFKDIRLEVLATESRKIR